MDFDVNNICRVCLETGNLKPIFSTKGHFEESITCVDMLLACASVTISSDDKLPSKICDHCLIKLKIAYTFRKKCESSYEYLCKNLDCNSESEPLCLEYYKDTNELIGDIKTESNNVLDVSFEPQVEIEECAVETVFEKSNEKHSTKIKIDQRKYGYFITSGVEDVGVDAEYMKALHRSYKHTCDLCPRRYSVKSYFQAHVNWHLGIKPYYCEMCKKNYADEKTHLKYHKQRRAKGECKCMVCDKAYSSVYSLKSHMKEHTGEKKWYPCSQCPRKFNQRGKLLNHMPVHTGEQNYICKACGKPFRFQKNLAVHFQTMHTTNRPNKCDMCEKAFVTRNELNYHRRKHLGIKRHPCDECPLSYYTTCELRRHKKVHSQDVTFACDTCGACYARQYILNKHIKQEHTTGSGNVDENATQEDKVEDTHQDNGCSEKTVNKRN